MSPSTISCTFRDHQYAREVTVELFLRQFTTTQNLLAPRTGVGIMFVELQEPAECDDDYGVSTPEMTPEPDSDEDYGLIESTIPALGSSMIPGSHNMTRDLSTSLCHVSVIVLNVDSARQSRFRHP